MLKLSIIEQSGKQHELHGDAGESVMEIAIKNSVTGIIGECGGNLACATCHVYVDAPWAARLEAPTPTERDMLEGAMHPRPSSRLSCQIRMTESLEGLVVTLPISQT